MIASVPILAPGVAEALTRAESFACDAEAAAYWVEAAPKVPAWDLTIPGAEGQPQPARLYRGGVWAPLLLYIHGGGWTGGSVALNEASARGLAAASGWNVLGISYRLAPEHPYPAGLRDCRAALDWLREHGAKLGVDTGLVAVGGASAGANLAMALALSLPRGALAGLLLFYGVFGADLATPSYRRYAHGPGLTRARMAALFEMYDPRRRRLIDPLIAPLLSKRLAEMPPACLIAAEHDVLCDDSRAMSAALQAAGVNASLHVEPGVTHGFINRGRLIPAAGACLARAADFLTRIKEPERLL